MNEWFFLVSGSGNTEKKDLFFLCVCLILMAAEVQLTYSYSVFTQCGKYVK